MDAMSAEAQLKDFYQSLGGTPVPTPAPTTTTTSPASSRDGKWARTAQGKGQAGQGAKRAWFKDWWQPETTKEEDRVKELEDLVQHLGRCVLRLEDELSAHRLETDYLPNLENVDLGVLQLFHSVSLKWNQQKQEKIASCSLRVTLMACLLSNWAEKLAKIQAEPDLQKTAQSMGWLKVEGSKLSWSYLRWDTSKGQAMPYGDSSLTNEEIMQAVEQLKKAFLQPNVLLRFRSTRPLAATYTGSSVAFLLTVGRPAGTRRQAASGQALPERCGEAHRSGTPSGQDGAAASSSSARRTHLSEPGFHGLSTATATPLDGLPVLPILSNPGQICYMNAVILVLWHLLHIRATGEASLGSLLTPLHSLKAGLRFTVTDMFPWRGSLGPGLHTPARVLQHSRIQRTSLST